MKKTFIITTICIFSIWFSLAFSLTISNNSAQKDQKRKKPSKNNYRKLSIPNYAPEKVLVKYKKNVPAARKKKGTKLAGTKRTLKKVGLKDKISLQKTSPQVSKKYYEKLSMPNYAPGEVLVKYKRGVNTTQRRKAEKTSGIKKTLKKIGFRNKIRLLQTNPNISVTTAIKKLKSQNIVEFAEPNYIRKLNYVPNDPSYNLQWHLNNTGQTGGVTNADIDAQEAWDIEKGYSSPATIAYIDTGIDQNHPDLSSKITPGYNFAGISQKYANALRLVGAYDTYEVAQSIKGTGQSLTHIGLFITKYGSPPGDIAISVRDTLDGPILASATIYSNEVGNTVQEVYKELNAPVVLSSGTTYYIVFKATAANPNRFYGIAQNYSEMIGYLPDLYRDGSIFEFNGSGWENYSEDDWYFRTNPNNNPRDDNGHGTHTSGIAAASTDNNTGVAGLSHGATIMPIKAADSAGYFYSQDTIDSIDFAVSNGAKVINMSFGGPGFSAAEQQAINDASDAGAVLVASAGNDGDSTLNYPAAYNNVIGTGCTDDSDDTCWFNNFNSSVDVTAPGLKIYSTMPTYPVEMNSGGYSNNYDYVSGTSMSAPLVSALASLVFSRDPLLSPSQVESFITDNADDLGAAGRDDYFGYGRINAFNTLQNIDLNLIQNSSFEMDEDSDIIPDNWQGRNLAAGDGRNADFSKAGSYSLKITGESSTAKEFQQRINVSGNAGDILSLSGWNKNEGATSAGLCNVALFYFNNADGTRTNAGYLFFFRYGHDWLQLSTNFTAPKDYTSMDIRLGYFYQTGATYYDNFSLLKQ